MSFSHVQGAGNLNLGAVTTLSVTLPAAPTQGNIVCVGFVQAALTSSLNVSDSNSNVYTYVNGGMNTNTVWSFLFILFPAPANASATITATWTGAAVPTIYADEFSYSGILPVFDTSFFGFGTGTAVNLPSITPTYANSLLYSVCGSGGTITSPTAGGTQGIWTGAPGGVQDGNMAEYVLAATGATPVNYVQGSALWAATVLSFGQLPASSTGPSLVSYGKGY